MNITALSIIRNSICRLWIVEAQDISYKRVTWPHPRNDRRRESHLLFLENFFWWN